MIGRGTYEPILMLITSEIFIPIAFAVPLLSMFKNKSVFDLENKVKYWTIFCLTTILVFWFGSTGYKFYNPINLNPRMFLLIVPPLSIVAAFSIIKAQENFRYYLIYALLFLIASVISFNFINTKLTFLYGILFLFAIGMYVGVKVFNRNVFNNFQVVLLIAILTIHPFISILNTDRENFKHSKAIVEDYLNKNEGEYVVLTDPLMRSGALYFYKFIPRKNYTYIGYKNAKDIIKHKADKYYILSNPKTLEELKFINPYQEYFPYSPKQWALISKRGNVSLYEITDFDVILKHP